jgi:hypothetical protein
MLLNSGANYAGKQPNNTSYIKSFYPASLPDLWKTANYNTTSHLPNVLTIASKTIQSILIPGNIYLGGSVNVYSDIQLKNNINNIEIDTSQQIFNLKPVSYVFKNDPNKLHYGLIAQDVEDVYPDLVTSVTLENNTSIKTVNYIELIPLMIGQITFLKDEVDKLKEEVVNLKTQLNKVS